MLTTSGVVALDTSTPATVTDITGDTKGGVSVDHKYGLVVHLMADLGYHGRTPAQACDAQDMRSCTKREGPEEATSS